VRQPLRAMAREAVDLLIAPREPGAAAGPQRVVPHDLVVRDSTSASSTRARPAPRRKS
jgi:DNA-binding LacI/PurR family transcriptional regulator